MKIAFDIRPLGEGIHSGVQEYTENLLLHLFAVLEPSDQLVLFSGGRKFDLKNKHIIKAQKENSNITWRHLDYPSKALNLFFSLAGGRWLEKKLGDPDVVFYPNINFYPSLPKAKTVLTVHDLSYFRYPNFFSYDRRFWHKLVRPYCKISRAEQIIAASHSTKDDLVDLLNVDKERIKVIYSGIKESFTDRSPKASSFSDLREKYRLPSDYILCLSTIEPRKNITNVVRAFEKGLKKENLVLVGPKGWSYQSLFREIKNSKARERINILGACRKEERAALYAGASVVVYPSYFEGFGLPPLEAMACGTPVIVSNLSSLPEVVEDAAIMVDPRRPEEISEAVRLLDSNQELKDKCIKEGLERAKEFDWSAAATKTYRLFKDLEKGSG